jgi:hypothetical protein
VPVLAYNKEGGYDPYPVMTVKAVDASTGRVLAVTKTLAPVSTELGCKNCHGGPWRVDGRAGLSGHVVAKFGSHVARVAIAGFLEGFGKALELSVTETTTNVFGTQSSQLENTSGETLVKAGAGRSIVNVAKDLQKFYLQLASQTMPVIEVGPTKNITVVISEGEELVIKERKTYAQKS